MSIKTDKQSSSSSQGDQDISRVVAQVLSDQKVASAVADLINSVRLSQLTQVSGKLDTMARQNTFKQGTLVAISLALAFGAGMFTDNVKSWPVMVAWVQQHVPPQLPGVGRLTGTTEE